MSEAVHEILERIQRLPAADRVELEYCLAQQAEAKWLGAATMGTPRLWQTIAGRHANDCPPIRYGAAIVCHIAC